jgi:APA family basic amino acid/polyamine antiporter
MNSQDQKLKRALGLRDSLAIVIGSMIGTGIFLKTAPMTQLLGSPFWVIMAWFAAGVLSFLGAITYAELGALFPRSGGGYLYIREAYGRLAGFLAGWISFWILFPGSIAAYAVAAATFMSGVFPAEYIKYVAPGLIVLFAALNCLAVSFGGFIQSLLTGIKVAIIAGLTLAIFFFTPHTATESTAALGQLTFGAFGLATLSALWAYDGWEAISRIAGEVRDPQRNVPLALVFGILTVFGLYSLLNVAYFWALPITEVANSNSTAYPEALPVATKAVLGFLGGYGAQILSAIFVVSTIGALNGCIMTSARVPFAMSQDKLFFSFLSKVSPHTHVPVRAVWMQALVAVLLAATGTFDQLTNYVVFSAWIFYGVTGYAVFIFRKRQPDVTPPFRVPFYPWTPALFVVLAAVLVVNTLIEAPIDSLIGIGLILTGLPVYLIFFMDERKFHMTK